MLSREIAKFCCFFQEAKPTREEIQNKKIKYEAKLQEARELIDHILENNMQQPTPMFMIPSPEQYAMSIGNASLIAYTQMEMAYYRSKLADLNKQEAELDDQPTPHQYTQLQR